VPKVPEVSFYKGQINAVGKSPVKIVQVPDWELDYIEVPAEELVDYRVAIGHERARIIKVTKTRIYFEPK